MKRKNLEKEFTLGDNNGKITFKCGYNNGVGGYSGHLNSFSIDIVKFSKERKIMFDERLGVHLTPNELNKLLIFLIKNK